MIAFTTLALLPLLASGAPTTATDDSALKIAKRDFDWDDMPFMGMGYGGGWGGYGMGYGYGRGGGWGGYYKRSEQESPEPAGKLMKRSIPAGNKVNVNKRQFYGGMYSTYGGYYGRRGMYGRGMMGGYYKRSEEDPKAPASHLAKRSATSSKQESVQMKKRHWGYGRGYPYYSYGYSYPFYGGYSYGGWGY